MDMLSSNIILVILVASLIFWFINKKSRCIKYIKNLTIKYYESDVIECSIKNYCNQVLSILNNKNIKYRVLRKKSCIDIVFCNEYDNTFSVKVNLNQRDLPEINGLTNTIKHFLL